MLRCIHLLLILGISQVQSDSRICIHSESRVRESIVYKGRNYRFNSHNINFRRNAVNEGPLPIYLDWRDKNAVTPVKQQDRCNACWAFSIVAAVESHLIIHNNEQEILSEQFLIDCDSLNKGCDSASLLQSYAYIVNVLGGILRDRDYYEYESRQSACRWRPPEGQNFTGVEENSQISHAWPVPVVGYTRIKANEDDIADALYRYGPVTAAINSASMANYNGGIDEPTDDVCDPGKPDHTVLIVGYNEYVPNDRKGRKVKYWIIKNSWGDQWGDQGFYYLVRGQNACGIANDVSLPFVSM